MTTLLGLLAAIVGAVVKAWGWLRGNRDQKLGRLEERSETQGQVIKDVEARNAVETDVAREPDPAERLRERWARD